MPRPICFALAALLLGTASLPLAAQKFIPKTIQFKGDPEYSDQELMDAAGLKKGVVLTNAEMSDHSKLLMDTGMFETLAYKFDGLDLIYSLTPSTLVYTARMENLPLTTGPELDAKLHARFPLYHGKVPSEGGMLEGVRLGLQDILAEQGIQATVAVVPSGDRGQRNKVAAMSFNITTPAVRIGEIHIEGASPATLTKLQRLLQQATTLPFDTENSAPNLERNFVNFYQDHGFAAAKVEVKRAGTPVQTADAILIPYTVAIQEGRVYKTGQIHLPQDALVSQEEIAKVLSAPSSDAGTGIRTVWSMIALRYKSKGYLDLAMTPHSEINEDSATVNYNVQIDPGPLYHVAFVKFENVSDALRSELMRYWQLMPGDAFDQTYVSTFIPNVQNKSPVLQRTLANVLAKSEVSADPQTHEVNIIIRLEKRP